MFNLNLASFSWGRRSIIRRLWSQDIESVDTREIGRRGEQVAFDYCLAKGWQPIARNWRHKLGELDLLFTSGGELIVVEVKSRLVLPEGSGAANFDVFAAVDSRKKRKLRLLLSAFRRQARERFSKVRIDLVGVEFRRGDLRSFDIRHLEAAVSD